MQLTKIIIKTSMSLICPPFVKLMEKGKIWSKYLNWHIYTVRIVINPDKRPYNISEVTLWSLDDDGNAVSHLEMDSTNEECYYFERLERVLATQVCDLKNVLLSRWWSNLSK